MLTVGGVVVGQELVHLLALKKLTLVRAAPNITDVFKFMHVCVVGIHRGQLGHRLRRGNLIIPNKDVICPQLRLGRLSTILIYIITDWRVVLLLLIQKLVSEWM